MTIREKQIIYSLIERQMNLLKSTMTGYIFTENLIRNDDGI